VGVSRVEDLVAYQLSLEFKRSVYALVRARAAAARDLRYRDQLFEAVSGASASIAEGFGRRTAKDFSLFLSYARGSIAEGITRVEDGVDRGHFAASDCADTLALGRRAAAAVAGLQRSLKPFIGSRTRPPA
jgi:four helix bundle protein